VSSHFTGNEIEDICALGRHLESDERARKRHNGTTIVLCKSLPNSLAADAPLLAAGNLSHSSSSCSPPQVLTLNIVTIFNRLAKISNFSCNISQTRFQKSGAGSACSSSPAENASNSSASEEVISQSNSLQKGPFLTR
jgi:hypothetical protein